MLLKSFKGLSSIAQSKWYHSELPQSFPDWKCGLLLFLGFKSNLPADTFQVQSRKQITTFEAVLIGDVIQQTVVHTEPESVVLLVHQYNRRNPRTVKRFNDAVTCHLLASSGLANGNLWGFWRIGVASPVSIACLTMMVLPFGPSPILKRS